MSDGLAAAVVGDNTDTEAPAFDKMTVAGDSGTLFEFADHSLLYSLAVAGMAEVAAGKCTECAVDSVPGIRRAAEQLAEPGADRSTVGM